MIDKEVLTKGVSGAVLILGAVGIVTEPEWTEDIVAGIFVVVGILEAIRTWYKNKYREEVIAVEEKVIKIAEKQRALESEVRMAARVEAGSKPTKK